MSMTDSVSDSLQPLAGVEEYDWIRTSSLSELVANFARVHILISLFDGDPDKWRQFILRDGTDEEREHDLPFLVRIKERIEADPALIPKMRRLVRELSLLFAEEPVTV